MTTRRYPFWTTTRCNLSIEQCFRTPPLHSVAAVWLSVPVLRAGHRIFRARPSYVAELVKYIKFHISTSVVHAPEPERYFPL